MDLPRCSHGKCRATADRIIKWKAKAAGESAFCEEHYLEYNKKYKKHIDVKPRGVSGFEKNSQAPPPATGELFTEGQLDV